MGQAPGPNTDPREPLHPSTKTGSNLIKHMGLTEEQYLETFDRVNLLNKCPGRWKRDDRFPRTHGRIAADAIKPFLKHRVVFLVGRNVAAAFGERYDTKFFRIGECATWDFIYICVPHPSGRNHWYNREEGRATAQKFWQEIFQMGLSFDELRSRVQVVSIGST